MQVNPYRSIAHMSQTYGDRSGEPKAGDRSVKCDSHPHHNTVWLSPPAPNAGGANLAEVPQHWGIEGAILTRESITRTVLTPILRSIVHIQLDRELREKSIV